MRRPRRRLYDDYILLGTYIHDDSIAAFRYVNERARVVIAAGDDTAAAARMTVRHDRMLFVWQLRVGGRVGILFYTNIYTYV